MTRSIEPMTSERAPLWARASDFLALALTALAVITAASGGFRIRTAVGRIALTSPRRVLLWAVAVIVARHLIARQEPVYRHLPALIARWARAVPLRAAMTTVVGTRTAIFFAGYLAVITIGYPPGIGPRPGEPPYRDYDNELLNLPLRWDAGWYLQIANPNTGYTYDNRGGSDVQQNIVFWPAFPFAVRVVALLFGNTKGAFLLAGTLVSLTAFLCALVYIYALARDHLSEEQSSVALWFLAAYPFAFFYGAVYTESLFLLGTAGAFYHLKRREFARAGLWGLVVGLTRANGCLLCVPLALIAIEPWLPARLVSAVDRPSGGRLDDRRTTLMPALAVAAMPCVGTLIYSAFVWSLTGNPLAWIVGHAAWGRRYTGLTSLVTDRYTYIANEGLYAYVSQLPLDLLNGMGVIFVLATAWPVARRLGVAFAVFMVINILVPIADGGLLSAGRFSSVLFPAFLWLASKVPAPHRQGWIATFAAIQAFNASLFYTWRGLY
jgi:hypothetical protein